MFSLYLECADDERDQLVAELHDRGTLGIVELTGALRSWFEDGTPVDDLIARYDGEVSDEPESDADWVSRTEASFPPIPLGTRFWLAPPWNHDPAPEGRLRLEILPGMACGTGWHECTQMCLELLERFVTPGCAVLDVGAGSGILSVAAAMLGATRVIACDIDPEAAALCRERLGANTVYTGGAEAARSAAFDIVVANISPQVVRDMESDFRRAARPGGIIVVSGFGDFPLLDPPRELIRRGEWLAAVL